MSDLDTAIERYGRQVFTFACYYLGSSSEAEDVAQEVFFKLWRNWGQVDKNKVGQWLTTVTRNTCFDLMRKRRGALKVGMEDAALWTLADSSPGPETLVLESDLCRLVAAGIARLAEPYRSLLILREIQALPYKKISEVLGMPLNTVKVYIRRGRRRLREDLRKERGDA